MDGASAPSNPSTMQGNLPSNLDRYLDSLSAPQYSGSIPPFVAGDNVDDAFASFWTNFDCNLPAAPLEEGGSEDLHTMLNRIWDAPSASSLNSYATMQSDASLVPTGNIQFSQLAPSAPGTTVPVNLTKENLHMYFPAWASIYKDIATIATSMMLVEEAVIWLPGESSGQRRLSEDQLIIHPLYKIAHRAHQIKLRYHRSLVENPPSSGG
jgi:hypothetical protein